MALKQLKIDAIVILTGIILQIFLAIWFDKRLHVKQPNARPFKWGYWNGLCCFLLTPLVGSAAAGPKTEFDVMILLEIIFIPLGIFVLLRHRWAFIAATALSFNPIYWIVNAIYISRRWTEMGRPDSRRSTTSARISHYKDPIASSARPLVHPRRSHGSLQYPADQSSPRLDSRAKEQMNKLNGWQRAWVVLAIMWAAFVVLVALASSFLPASPAQELSAHINITLAFWAAPLIAIYLLGIGVAWVRAGFRQKKDKE